MVVMAASDGLRIELHQRRKVAQQAIAALQEDVSKVRVICASSSHLLARPLDGNQEKTSLQLRLEFHANEAAKWQQGYEKTL